MSCVGHLQLSVRELQLFAPATFLTHDAAGNVCYATVLHKPHYASCPSVRLSVRPSVPYGLLTGTQKGAEEPTLV